MNVSNEDLSLYFKENIDRQEIYRYLRQRNTLSQAWISEIETCIDEVIQWSNPKFIDERFEIKSYSPLIIENDLKSLKLESKDLERHLNQSNQVTLCAVTLGFQLERQINMKLKVQPTKGVIWDAVASVLIESYCDYIEEREIKYPQGAFRFSPGYGDLDLSYQSLLAEVLQVQKRLGIFVSSHYMMSPQKSVIFIKGNQSNDLVTCQHKCASCQLAHCIYREKGESNE